VVEETDESVENTTDEATDVVEETGESVENTTGATTDTVQATSKVIGNATLVDNSQFGPERMGSSSGPDAGGIGKTTIDSAGASGTPVASDTTSESEAEGDVAGDDPTDRQTDVSGTTDAAAVGSADSADSADPDGGSDDRASGGTVPGAGGDVPLPFVGFAVGAAGLAGAAALGSSVGDGIVRTSRSLLVVGRGFHVGGVESVRVAGRGLRGWLTDARDRLWRLAALFRYSRYDDSDPLDHDRRRAIYETIADHPGVYLSAIDEQTGGSLSSVRHHLRILEEEGLITARKFRGKRRYFPVTRDAEDPAMVAALEDRSTASLLETLAETGPATGGRLAEKLDLDPSTVSHHLSRLEEEGLVDRERDGRAVVNALAGPARRVLTNDADAEDGDQPARPSVADD